MAIWDWFKYDPERAARRRQAVAEAAEERAAALAKRVAEARKAAEERAADIRARQKEAAEIQAARRKETYEAAEEARRERTASKRAAELKEGPKPIIPAVVMVTVRTIPGANISYGNNKHGPWRTKTDWSGIAQFDWPLYYGKLFVNAQKTDYVFSNFKFTSITELPTPRLPTMDGPPSIPVIREPYWGSISRWFLVSPVKREITLFPLARGAEPKEVIKGIKGILCDIWKTTAEMVVPAKLSSYFSISISDAMWICETDPSITDIMTGVSAIASIGEYDFEIPITNGRGSLNIGAKPEIRDLITSLVPPLPTSIPIEISLPNKIRGGFTSQIYHVEPPVVEIPAIGIPVVEIVEIPELGKIIKIIGDELKAFEGMDVTISAVVMCGARPSNGEPAILLIDGKEIERKNTANGFVSFKWTATAEPTRTHRVVVSVPKSEQCPMYGDARDSRSITVSRMVPGIEERLRIEREEYQSRLAAMREERERIREMSLAARAAVTPVTPIIPAIPVTPIIPAIPIIPVTPVTPVEEVEVPAEPGIIEIPAIEAPPGIEYPVNIFIDGVLKGPPPLKIEVVPGKHEIRVELKNFPSLYRSVTLTEGQTLSITDLRFT